MTADLLAKTAAQRLAIPVMHPGRADVIGAGALVLRVIMERAGMSSVVASEHDILDGIAWSLQPACGRGPASTSGRAVAGRSADPAEGVPACRT